MLQMEIGVANRLQKRFQLVQAGGVAPRARINRAKIALQLPHQCRMPFLHRSTQSVMVIVWLCSSQRAERLKGLISPLE